MTIVEPVRFRLLRGTVPYLISLAVEEGLRTLNEFLRPRPTLTPPGPKGPVRVPRHGVPEEPPPKTRTPRTAMSDMCRQHDEAKAPYTGRPRCGMGVPLRGEGGGRTPRAMWRPTGDRSKVDRASGQVIGRHHREPLEEVTVGTAPAAMDGSPRGRFDQQGENFGASVGETMSSSAEEVDLRWRPQTRDEGPLTIRLVPVGQAALQARGCPGLIDALRLTSWVGSAVPLARGGGPERFRAEDRSRAAADLGLPPKEIPQVFEAALRAGFLYTSASDVLPEDAMGIWYDDERLVRAWSRALPVLAGPDPALRVLEVLFTCGRGRSLEELAHELDDTEGVPAAVHSLIRSGAVEPLPNGRVRITRLGDHGMARRRHERDEPLSEHPRVCDLSARALLLLLWGSRSVDVETMGAEWVAERGAREAARSLLAACTDPADWRLRVRAFRVLRGVGSEADEVLDTYRDHPVLGGWVAHARCRTGRVRSAQLVMAVLDTYAVRVDSGLPLPEDRELWRDPETVTKLMWGSGHPAADSVLSAIALGALGPRPARAARRTPVFYNG
ncbi:MAG TPA: hypothetical protein K8V84_03230 [Nocardiopsis listeri]|uniref:hypothetical protein n=1 Tax=Nocardiopsis listeri TaxID=53440 RepID=UPI001DACAE2D|nr:hypothetical protein [Nocardiopsis listeri]HJE57517.1 hypothetical protein [Nocardiopsis listeri]